MQAAHATIASMPLEATHSALKSIDFSTVPMRS
jgi:hypothetical protein